MNLFATDVITSLSRRVSWSAWMPLKSAFLAAILAEVGIEAVTFFGSLTENWTLLADFLLAWFGADMVV